MRTTRLVAMLGVTAALAGCRSTQKITISDEGNARPALSLWVGQNLVLRHFGDRSEVVMKPGETPKGTCDVAVRVSAAEPIPSGVRFTLAAVGRLRIADGSTVGLCKMLVPRIGLTLKPADAVHSETWRDPLGKVLMTPEAYLAANGRTFNLPAGAAPKAAADPSIMADEEARRMARHVTSWPKPLFEVEPAFAAASGKVHYEGEITFEAIVGADGRVFEPKVKTSLDDAQIKQVISALDLWRFEPAREADHAIAARYEGRTVLRIY
jgi:hypothetical protein